MTVCPFSRHPVHGDTALRSASQRCARLQVVKTNFENVGGGEVGVNIFYSVEFLYQKVMVLAGIFSCQILMVITGMGEHKIQNSTTGTGFNENYISFSHDDRAGIHEKKELRVRAE